MDEKKDDTTKKLQNLVKKRGAQTLIYKQAIYKQRTRKTQALTPESYTYDDD